MDDGRTCVHEFFVIIIQDEERYGPSCCDNNSDEQRDESVSHAFEHSLVDEELEQKRDRIRDQRGD